MAFSIGLGTILGFSIFRISLNKIQSVLLSILLLPILLGNTSIAFIFWSVFKNFQLFERLSTQQPLWENFLLVLLHSWQYGFLFAYLIWLNLQFVKRNVLQYSVVSQLTSFELVRDILFPSCKNLIIILSVLSFSFAFYQDANSKFILKASPGNGTELVTAWLFRIYNSGILKSFEFAYQKIIAPAILTTGICALIYLFLLILIPFFFRIVSKEEKMVSKLLYLLPIPKNRLAIIFGFLIISAVLFPILATVKFNSESGVFFESRLLKSVGYTLIAATIATLTSIKLSIMLRIGFQKFMDSFNFRSNILLLFLYLLLLVPSLLVYLAGYKWAALFSVTDSTRIVILWVTSHVIFTIPLLSSFLFSTHFNASNKELDFQAISEARALEIIKISFLKRFWLQYLLAFIFSFALIWNESTLNRVYSDTIPAFSPLLEMAIQGRAADMEIALAYYLISLSIASIGVLVWIMIMNKVSNMAKQLL